MNKAILLLGAVVVVAGVAYAVVPFGASAKLPDCDRAAAGVDEAAPLELAAIHDYDCARVFLAENDDRAAALAADLGYPSLAEEYASSSDYETLVIGAVDAGDRGFFAADPKALEATAEGEGAGFVQAIFDPAGALAGASEPAEVLHGLDIWNNDDNAALLVENCAAAGCESDATSCPSRLGLADKVKIASGAMGTADAVALCEPSFEWILALRRAGVVDTLCSASLQVNAGMADQAYLAGPCYPDGMAISEFRTWASADTARFLRAHAGEPISALIDADAAEMIEPGYPALAAFAQQSGESE
ncbi:hypothetical protein [Oceanicola sp. 502str15]|uniref:hypothetical protein n=1 Tax=Oceanicola sp. 502str15 TaxID=2696061 RepID=UPI0020954AFC|nr:hypothetical protein [Oceanicola sp. 502str15]MCO6383055.1 hypothetical protein [Oceanicola sp. 502str15]